MFGQLSRQTVTVSVGNREYSFKFQFLTCSYDTDCNLTSVGDENTGNCHVEFTIWRFIEIIGNFICSYLFNPYTEQILTKFNDFFVLRKYFGYNTVYPGGNCSKHFHYLNQCHGGILVHLIAKFDEGIGAGF